MVLAPLASLVVNPHMYKSVGYDTLQGFRAGGAGRRSAVAAGGQSVAAGQDGAELIAYAKANPDKLAQSLVGQRHAVASGHGGVQAARRRQHPSRALSRQRAGDGRSDGRHRQRRDGYRRRHRAVHPRRQDAPDRQRLCKRVAAFPDTPTVAERVFRRSICRHGSASSSPPARRRSGSIASARPSTRSSQSPEIVEKFASLGAIPRDLGPKEFGAFLASEDARWGAVVKDLGRADRIA